MSNTYDATQAITKPEYAEAGSRRTAPLFSGYRNGQNLAHARGGNSTVVSQSFPDGLFHVDMHNPVTQTGFAFPVMIWRVPIVDNSRSLKIQVVASRMDNPFNAQATAELVFKAVQSNLTKVIQIDTPTGIGRDFYTTEIPVSRVGEYETIELRFNAFAPSSQPGIMTNGGDFQIHTITMWWDLHASPLAPGFTRQFADAAGVTTHRFQGIGQASTMPNNPISAPFGKILIDNMEAIDQRIETGLCWSGVQLSANVLTATGRGHHWFDVSTPALIRQREGQYKIRFEIQVSNPSHPDANGNPQGEDLDIVFCVTGGHSTGLQWPRNHRDTTVFFQTRTVAVGIARTWISVETPYLNLSSLVSGTGPDRAIQAGIIDSRLAAERNGTDNRTRNLHVDQPVEINSISIWVKP